MMKNLYVPILVFFVSALVLRSQELDTVSVFNEKEVLYRLEKEPLNPDIIHPLFSKKIDSSKWFGLDSIDAFEFTNYKQIWVIIKLPDTTFTNPALYIHGFLNSLHIFLDSKKIFDYQEKYPEKKSSKRSFIIPIQKDYQNKNILVSLNIENLIEADRVELFFLGSLESLIELAEGKNQELLLSNIWDVFFGSILFFFGCLSIFLFFKTYKEKIYPLLFLGLLTFVTGLDFFATDELTIFLSSITFDITLTLVSLISFFIFCSLPILYCLTLEHVFGKGWKSLIRRIWQFQIVVSLILFTIVLINLGYILVVYIISLLLLIIELILVIVVFFVSRFHRQENAKPMIIPTLIYILFALSDVVVSQFWDDSYMGLELFPYGNLIFLFGFIQMVVQYYKRRITQAEEYKLKLKEQDLELFKLKEEYLESQYEALKNQVNPHFLFNTFSNLITAIEEDQNTAIDYVQQLSRVYRYVLQSKDKKLVELREELIFIDSYFFLIKKRFQEGIIIDIQIPEKYLSKIIVPLSLQILVENVIKHNSISYKKPLRLFIFVDTDSNYLVVENSFQPRTTLEQSTGIGLENIKDRYSFFTGKKVKIEKSANKFKVSIPLIKNEKSDESNNN
ncbi:MAG: histidine kinase [Ignavibacteria bacterium]|jgi:sensor histidine kinase YesM